MGTTSPLTGSLRAVLEHPTRGVVGIVDDLFSLCPGHGLKLDWRAGHCRIFSVENGCDNVVDMPLRKSVFRAILTRIAALCNEQGHESVAPYGGQAQLRLGEDRPANFQVEFVNTSDEQKLAIMPSANRGSLHQTA
jgi:hypothetical protein